MKKIEPASETVRHASPTMLAAWAATSRPNGFSAYVRGSRVRHLENEGTRRAVADVRALGPGVALPSVHLDVTCRSGIGDPVAMGAA